LIDCWPLPVWSEEYHAYRLIGVQNDATADFVLTPGKSRSLVLEFPDGKVRDTAVLGLHHRLDAGQGVIHSGKSTIVGLAENEVRRLFLSTNDGKFGAAAVVHGRAGGPVTVKLQPTGTITGRVVDREGKAISGVGFQFLFDDGPGRPGVFVHGSTVQRVLAPAEVERYGRTRGFFRGGLGLSLSEKTDRQGRFRITGLLPDVAFDLIVQLEGPPNARGQRPIAAKVKIARPTVKPGATLDLGDLRALAPPK
jgi:hypothetical protein